MFNLDVTPNRQSTRAVTRVPQVVDTVTVTPVESKRKPEPVSSGTRVTWQEVRDYVVAKIQEGGPTPRNERNEKSTFMAFVSRWQDLAMPIARYAFEDCGGMWMNAPVGVHRFHRSADDYFAKRIAQKLR